MSSVGTVRSVIVTHRFTTEDLTQVAADQNLFKELGWEISKAHHAAGFLNERRRL